MQEIEAALALSLVKGLGSVAVAQLWREFGTLRLAFEADASQWQERAKVPETFHAQARSDKHLAQVPLLLERCGRLNIVPLPLGSQEYPEALASTHDPPGVLYVKGEPAALADFSTMVAVVGTRKPSGEGLAFSYRLGADLSQAGVTVVSGLAVGIDAQVHRGVVDAGGKGVAVLAAGLDRIYPSENRTLARHLQHDGCIVSEEPPGTVIHRGKFVARNRIISGLSRAVAVVEAAHGSGAITTVNFALDEGRSVYAMPGRPNDPRVAGCLQLLQEGASLLTGANEILRELELACQPEAAPSYPELGPTNPRLLESGASFDMLMAASGLSPPELLAVLGRLELAGRLRRGEDGLYYAGR